VFLGTVEIATGEYLWGTVRSFPYRTVREALEAEPRPNAEGMVMWLNWSTPVKIKQEDYKALHKIISGLSQKEVWRQLSAGTYEEWVKGLPDEFYEWAEDTAWGFRATVGNRGGEIQREYESLMLSIWHDFPFVNDYPSREDKKRFALEAVKSPNKSYLFTLFDGGSIAPALWKSIEPKGI
jgi:RNA ligase